MKTFKNRHNQCIKQDGKEYWISRSVAVIGTILLVKPSTDNNYDVYVLLSKRGEGTPDYKGYWNLICGYLDWDESGIQAVKREVWEESGLDLDEIINCYNIIDNRLNNPFRIDTEPSSNRQNVSLSYGLAFKSYDFPTFDLSHMEPNEVSDVKWVNIKDIDQYQIAFGHEKIIKIYNDLI